MAPHKALQESLYGEMLARIKQTDLSVPARSGEYWYYSRTEEGKQYPYMCRRKGSMDGSEEVLLDLNHLAEGHPYLGVGAYAVSDDANWLAFSLDTTGYRQYTLQVKDLRTGALLDERIERVGTVAWANDNRTIFYTTEDPTTKRTDTLWRRTGGDGRIGPRARGAGRALRPRRRAFARQEGDLRRGLREDIARVPLVARRRSCRRLPGRRAQGRGARVRRGPLRGAVLHHDEQGGEELQGGHRPDERSVRGSVEHLHRAQPRGEDRRPLVLQGTPGRVGAGRGTDLPAHHRDGAKNVASDCHRRA